MYVNEKIIIIYWFQTDSLGAKLEQIRVEHINYCFYFPSEHCKVVTKDKSQEKS